MNEEDKDEKESKRKLVEKDWKVVQQFIKDTLDERKRSDFRKYHEEIWKEVDRQVVMKPLKKVNRDGAKDDQGWHNVFELGELARSSDVNCADVKRIMFPQSRSWFDPHVELKGDFDVQTGRPIINTQKQQQMDGLLRSLMAQQHQDFGFQDRFELSLREANHHGGFVAEVRLETRKMVYEGTKVKDITAPVWVPHSMWNSYPDPSPSVIGTDLFYDGSMIIESYTPRYKLKEMCHGDGWMPNRLSKVPKEEHVIKENRTKDIKLTTFWGDIVIPRSQGSDLYYPSHKVILANGTVIYFAPFELPYAEIIYRGYEKMDVRDPYFLSPIIKFSPMHKMATILANRFVDAIELDIEPPVVYDGNDGDLVMTDGPILAPGSKIAAKTAYQMKFLESGDPNAALEGLKLALDYLNQNLGRPGAAISERPIQAEVDKKQQDSEVGLVGFVTRLETALRSFLHMQHELNRKGMERYSFYNPEPGLPDFVRAEKKDLPESVQFEIIGARGVLGERQRQQGMATVTDFASKHPLFAPLLKPHEILTTMYQDVGVKNPDNLVKGPQEMGLPPEAKQIIMQLQLQMKKLMEAYKKEKTGNDVKRERHQIQRELGLLKIAAHMEETMAKIAHDKDSKQSDLFMEIMGMTHELESEQRALEVKQDVPNKDEKKVPTVDAKDPNEEDMKRQDAEKIMMQLESLAISIEGVTQAVAENTQIVKETVEANTQSVKEAVEKIANSVNTPKEIVFKNGKPVGIRPVENISTH